MKRLLLVGAFAALVASGCSDGASPAAPATLGEDEGPTITTSTTAPAASTTATSAPATPGDNAEPEPDGEGFDIDREFSADSEAEATGPLGSTETTIPTVEGEVSIGGGEVPELGEGFPLPEGFEVQLSTEIEGELGVSGRVDGEFTDLIAFFETALASAGYEIVERQEVPDTFAVLTVEGPLNGDVVISQEPGGSGWTVAVALAEA